ncbi:unnamed protein product [Rangifer tarandus platyrhynchus]|uniref:Uncharacterized protein n=2 Tax=Rangifer tarandus platyrhynchus TaxID=3082113 RepID=A0ABN8YCX2_RANTA|nr:unnamed protein product [Rangifer tarandus platyrhynchus]
MAHMAPLGNHGGVGGGVQRQNGCAQVCGPLMSALCGHPTAPECVGDCRRVRRRVEGNKGSTTVPWPSLFFTHATLTVGPKDLDHSEMDNSAAKDHMDTCARSIHRSRLPCLRMGWAPGESPESGAEVWRSLVSVPWRTSQMEDHGLLGGNKQLSLWTSELFCWGTGSMQDRILGCGDTW